MKQQKICDGSPTTAGENRDSFRRLLCVARHGGVAAAAKALCESPPTVGRKIRELERSLATRLITRTATGTQLTDCGRRTVERVRRIARETQAIRDEVGSGDDRLEGEVVVAAPQGFAMAAVSSRLKAFSARRPGIEIEFRLGAQKAHMANRDADIAVRIGDPARHSLIGRRVGEIGFTICSSAEYLSAADAPMAVSDLARRRLID